LSTVLRQDFAPSFFHCSWVWVLQAELERSPHSCVDVGSLNHSVLSTVSLCSDLMLLHVIEAEILVFMVPDQIT